MALCLNNNNRATVMQKQILDTNKVRSHVFSLQRKHAFQLTHCLCLSVSLEYLQQNVSQNSLFAMVRNPPGIITCSGCKTAVNPLTKWRPILWGFFSFDQAKTKHKNAIKIYKGVVHFFADFQHPDIYSAGITSTITE